jgi:hypothetical protein
LESQLFSLCEFPATNPQSQWLLLYRASRDGFSARDFHLNCDKLPNTLVVIKSSMGQVFGGYTRAAWDESGCHKTDKDAFLFSLINKENEPVKLKIIPGQEKYAILCHSSYGPIFGNDNEDANDIVICSNSHANRDSHSNLGSSFAHPNYAVGSDEAKSFLAGSFNFKVADVECFQNLNKI